MLEFPGCGDRIPTPQVIGTENGGFVPFFVTGTDPDIGGGANQDVDMTVEAGDFVPSALGTDGTFIILIETAAPIKVQLANGDDFLISQAQADAYVGQWYPAKLIKVYKAGSTGKFSVGR